MSDQQRNKDDGDDEKEDSWVARMKKMLIDDTIKHKPKEWDEDDRAVILQLEKDFRRHLDMFTTASTHAEDTNDFWCNLQLACCFIGTSLSFLAASSMPGSQATLSFFIGIISILATAIAELLKKKKYAVKASELDRVRAEYQCAYEKLKSEIAFPKHDAIAVESNIRRLLQDFDIWYMQIQPPPEIKEMYGFTCGKSRKDLGFFGVLRSFWYREGGHKRNGIAPFEFGSSSNAYQVVLDQEIQNNKMEEYLKKTFHEKDEDDKKKKAVDASVERIIEKAKVIRHEVAENDKAKAAAAKVKMEAKAAAERGKLTKESLDRWNKSNQTDK